MRQLLFWIAALLMGLTGPAMAQPTGNSQRLLGGDVSLLPSYEQAKTVYRNEQGKKIKPLNYWREQGWNALRVRLFVNPELASESHKDEGVCQDLDYVVQLSRHIKKAGYQLLLDFHYSDTWADPGKQYTPHLWQGCNAQELADSVYAHTRHALQVLKAAGAAPDLIQVGNEITNGMLWPTAHIDPTKDEGWPVLCLLLQAGSKACREECPEARIIIHTEKAGSWPITYSYYRHLRQHEVDYDIIGLSYYPMWHGSLPHLGHLLHSLAQEFPDKEVMVVETAAYYSHDNDPWSSADRYSEYYPISPEGQRQFTQELVAELRQHDNVTGLFWWFPEENGYKNHVTKHWLNRGLFDNHTGRALPALKELSTFAQP